MMREAVESAFDFEVNRNGKVSTHSQLERWIVQELAKTNNPDDLSRPRAGYVQSV